MSSFAYKPVWKLGISLFSSAGPLTAVASTTAVAISLPFIISHARPGCLTALAEDAWPRIEAEADSTPSTSVISSPTKTIDAASPEEPIEFNLRQAAKSVLSVLHPKNVFLVFCKNLALRSLLKFNQYMLDLLEHEKKALEAEEQGQPVPDPPPIPDFKPSFTQGAWQAVRELGVAMLRKVYEIVAMQRLGAKRADPFLRDYKNWVKDVLQFRHRLDPLNVRFIKYLFAILHGTFLHYAADCTVAVMTLVYRAASLKHKKRTDVIVMVLRGATAQVVLCIFRFSCSSVGGAVGSLSTPGFGTSAGSLLGDLIACTLAAPFVAMIAGPAP